MSWCGRGEPGEGGLEVLTSPSSLLGSHSVDPSSLDPTQWKEQDHYAVLGLGDIRHAASQEQIKKACE